MSQYDRCSPNSACACFHIAGAINIGICGDEFVDCSALITCEQSSNVCHEPNHRCVHHPRCRNLPVCYPIPSFNQQLCPPIAPMHTTTSTTTTTTNSIQQLRMIPNIPVNAQWRKNAVTVAGGLQHGGAINQLQNPHGIFVDDDQTMIIADWGNARIVQWQLNDTKGQVIAGGNGHGSRLDQLYDPTSVLIDKEMDNLIICDRVNRRVVQWSRHPNTTQGEILIDNIPCRGVAMDNQRYLYVADEEKHEVRRYQIGDKNGTIVAGGNGNGTSLNQLSRPGYIFVDREQTVYISDNYNFRVVKWNKDAQEGTVVAGGHGKGNALTQFAYPRGVFVDTLHTIYVADAHNHRVIRWPKEAKEGTIIVGGNGEGREANQLRYPEGLFFDRYGNLYVADNGNTRVQRFFIE
ncbi:unnamed protein product [Rotaria sordida]|uniref:Uncharacterized protein n=2 Tax=Rotaria sordida TaxID=392033 RepID=A0A815J4E9_9BILA|nr:unnamed protein product [Rotaria sordida]